MYSITEVLERFPLPVTIKPVKLDKHSKIDMDLYIPSSISPNRKQGRQSATKFGLDLRMDQLICGYKEMLVLLKPWKKIFQKAPPKLPVRGRALSRFFTNPLTQRDLQAGVYPFTMDKLRRKTFEDIQYISRPIIPQVVPEPPPRPQETFSSSEMQNSSRLSLPDQSRNMSRSLPDMDKDVLLKRGDQESSWYNDDDHDAYEEISDEDPSCDDRSVPDYLSFDDSNQNTSQTIGQKPPWLALPDQPHKSRSLPDMNYHILLDTDHQLPLDKYGYLALEDESVSYDADNSDGYEKIDDEDVSSDNRIGNEYPMTANDTKKGSPLSTRPVSQRTGQLSQEEDKKEIRKEISLSEAESGMFEMEDDFHNSKTTLSGEDTFVSEPQRVLQNDDVKRDDADDVDNDEEYVIYLPESRFSANSPSEESAALLSDLDVSVAFVETRGVDGARKWEEENKAEGEEDYYEDVGLLKALSKRKLHTEKENGNSRQSATEPVCDTKLPILPGTDEVDGLSVEEVIFALRSLKIPESVQELFRDEQVDGTLLKDMCEMDDSIMQEQFGMKPFHAMKLKKFINGWRPNLN
ncbi:uncharacterized protein [Amphiura filiformis]|uniref:uncharacterized protein isoform X2 n=1 Tax=Amphiura filiformis TaxID=82378 RepID=UPI003B20E7F6